MVWVLPVCKAILFSLLHHWGHHCLHQAHLNSRLEAGYGVQAEPSTWWGDLWFCLGAMQGPSHLEDKDTLGTVCHWHTMLCHMAFWQMWLSRVPPEPHWIPEAQWSWLWGPLIFPNWQWLGFQTVIFPRITNRLGVESGSVCSAVNNDPILNAFTCH